MDAACAGLAAMLIWCGTLTILCGQLNGAAVVLTGAAGVPHAWGCLIGAGVMTAYFIAGGLASAARVNSIQLVVKLVGFAIAAPLALMAAGGLHEVTALNAGRLTFWHGTSATEGWPRIFLLGPAFFLSPGLIQKAYGARNEQALTRGVAWNGVCLMLFAIVPVILGLSARAVFPGLEHPDDALPAILGRLPLAVGGLALAAVFSAEMGAADAVLFMLSTSGARDLYKGFMRPAATDAEVLRAARITAVLGRRARLRADVRAADGRRRPAHVLFDSRREPLRADSRRPVPAARRPRRRAGLDGHRRRHALRDAFDHRRRGLRMGLPRAAGTGREHDYVFSSGGSLDTFGPVLRAYA